MQNFCAINRCTIISPSFVNSRDRVERANALPYTWELREKQTQLEWFKVVASYLLSNIGLFALTVLYAIIGKCIISFSFKKF